MISLSRRRELRGVRLPRVFGRETERIRSAEEILGKTIRPAPRDGHDIYVTVTGVFDAGDDFSAYDDLRDAELPDERRGRAGGTFSDVLLQFLCFRLLCLGSVLRVQPLIRREPPGVQHPAAPRADSTTARRLTPRSRRAKTVSAADGAPCGGAARRCAEALFAYYGREEEARDLAYSIPYAYLPRSMRGRSSTRLIFPVIGAAAGVLAVFAALLLFSFISASINAKKKEIGILRAVGARGIDVFKIFIVEGIAVTLLCLVFGIAGALPPAPSPTASSSRKGCSPTSSSSSAGRTRSSSSGSPPSRPSSRRHPRLRLFQKKPVETIRSV